MAQRTPNRGSIAFVAAIAFFIYLSWPHDRPITPVKAAPHEPPPAQQPEATAPQPVSALEALERRLDTLTQALLARLDEAERAEAKRDEQRIATALAEVPLHEATRQARGAELALTEYRDKTHPSERHELDEEIKYHEAELARTRDRLSWAEGMYKNKLLSDAQLGNDKSALIRIELILKQALGRREMLDSTTKPRRLAEMEGEIERTGDELRVKTLLRDRERAREAAADLEAHAAALNAAEARGLALVLEAGAIRDRAIRATVAADKNRLVEQLGSKLRDVEARWSEAVTARAESRKSEVEKRLRRAAMDTSRLDPPPPPPRPDSGPMSE